MKIRTLGLCVLLATGTVACVRETTAPIPGAVAYTGTTAAHDNDNGQNGGEGANFERFAVGAIDGQFDWKSLGGTGAPLVPVRPGCRLDRLLQLRRWNDRRGRGFSDLGHYLGFRRHGHRRDR